MQAVVRADGDRAVFLYAGVPLPADTPTTYPVAADRAFADPHAYYAAKRVLDRQDPSIATVVKQQLASLWPF